MKNSSFLFTAFLMISNCLTPNAFAITGVEIRVASGATFTDKGSDSSFISITDPLRSEALQSAITDLRLPDEAPINAMSRGYASSNYGALKALAFEQTDEFSKAGAQATATFGDNITISGGPSYLGAKGTARVLFSLDEAVTPNTIATRGVSGGDATFSFSTGYYLFSFSDVIGCNDGHCVQVTQADDSLGKPYMLGPGLKIFEVEFPVTFDQPIDIHLFSTASASGGEGATALTADSSHSFYWGGIQLISDIAGNSTDNFVVTSLSGVDYKRSFIPASVPEPGSLALFILGAASLAHLRRNEQVNDASFEHATPNQSDIDPGRRHQQ